MADEQDPFQAAFKHEPLEIVEMVDPSELDIDVGPRNLEMHSQSSDSLCSNGSFEKKARRGKQKYLNYNRDNINEAYKAVKEGMFTATEAAIFFEVPRRTLNDRLMGRTGLYPMMRTSISPDDEKEVCC